MAANIDVSIIIVSWNVKEHLRTCLQSIYKYTQGISFEVVVVDNDSTDGSADMVASNFPQAKLLRNSKNRGFGAANNQGLEHTSGRWVLFLNDDTAIESDILTTLVRTYDADPDLASLGMIGCRLSNPDGSLQPSVRAFPTLTDQLIILLKLHIVFPSLVAKYMKVDFDYAVEQEVDQLMGAFMLVPSAVLEKVGNFDEQFFTWFEEVDLQKRMQQYGYTMRYTPVAECTHVKGASFSQWRRPKAQWLFNRSMRTYFKKHHSAIAYGVLLTAQPISIILAYAVQVVR